MNREGIQVDSDEDEFYSLTMEEEMVLTTPVPGVYHDCTENSLCDIENQTSGIVDDFMCLRYAQEVNVSSNNSMCDFSYAEHSCTSVESQLAHHLAYFGDYVDRRYHHQFCVMVQCFQSQQPSGPTAYESFASITRKLFQSGITWGRIVALLNFGFRIVMDMVEEGADFFSRIVAYVFRFIVSERIINWIAEHGGWAGVVGYFRQLTRRSWRLTTVVVTAAVATVTFLCLMGRRMS